MNKKPTKYEIKPTYTISSGSPYLDIKPKEPWYVRLVKFILNLFK